AVRRADGDADRVFSRGTRLPWRAWLSDRADGLDPIDARARRVARMRIAERNRVVIDRRVLLLEHEDRRSVHGHLAVDDADELIVVSGLRDVQDMDGERRIGGKLTLPSH